LMNYLHANQPSREPAPPAGLSRVKVDYGDEWFIAGTEPTGLRAQAETRPAIAYPGDGAIFGVDPEIPRDRQRIFFRWTGQPVPGRTLAWQLNGKTIGEKNPLPWKPTIGRYKLSLVECRANDCRHVRDERNFEVR